MAYLGALSQRNKVVVFNRILPNWIQGYSSLQEIDSKNYTGIVSGHVSVDGVAQVGVPVYIYYSPTGKLIQTVTTDSNGDYSCNILDTTDLSNYFAVCITSYNYNAIIFDKLTAG